MGNNTSRIRDPALLVAPLVTFAAVVLLLVVARFYDTLPVHAPTCGFRSTFGIPCVGCGGTRSMKALASGNLGAAITFNPAVVLGTFVCVIWFFLGLYRFYRGAIPLSVQQTNHRIRRVSLIALCLLVLNWIYLILFLK